VSGCGMTIYSETVGMVRGTGVPSDGGVVVMVTLHPRGIGRPELPPSVGGHVILIDRFLENTM
jgi:hypothetical protein